MCFPPRSLTIKLLPNPRLEGRLAGCVNRSSVALGSWPHPPATNTRSDQPSTYGTRNILALCKGYFVPCKGQSALMVSAARLIRPEPVSSLVIFRLSTRPGPLTAHFCRASPSPLRASSSSCPGSVFKIASLALAVYPSVVILPFFLLPSAFPLSTFCKGGSRPHALPGDHFSPLGASTPTLAPPRPNLENFEAVTTFTVQLAELLFPRNQETHLQRPVLARAYLSS